MSVSPNVQKFRREIASDLFTLIKLLKTLTTCTCDPTPIYNAAKKLEDFTRTPKVKESHTVDYDFWGYNINRVVFQFNHVPRNTYPEKAYNMRLELDINLVADYKNYGNYADPFKHLEFNIVVRGDLITDTTESMDLICSYHLDRHLREKDDRDPEEVHPDYHFQFGGHKLEKNGRNFGCSLMLDSPRIVHYPLDIILGVDFVLANFFGKDWREIRRKGDYVSLVRKYQNAFWRPYAHAKASMWPSYGAACGWSPIQIWPNLLN